MKNIEIGAKKKYLKTMTAVAEGLWSGIVVSGVLAVSAVLIKTILTLISQQLV